MNFHSSLFTLCCILLVGCSVGPSYQPPCIETPQEWKTADNEACETVEGATLDHWWMIFEDEELNQLEDQAVQNNKNLFVAWERIQEARALMGIAEADLYPQLTLNPQYTNTQELIQAFNVTDRNPIFRAHELFYYMPLNLSYEVDLWGKIRQRYYAADYNWQAEIKDYEAVMLALTTDLATAYFQLKAADAQIDLLWSTYNTRLKAFEINQDRFEGEISFYADVTLAGEEVDVALDQYYEMIRQRQILENQIAVLLGVPASEFCLAHMPLIGLPPCIPAGLPSDVLLRRPDIAEAELNMKAQHALIKQAYAQYFPSLTLTMAGGSESPIFKDFFKKISRFWMLGGSANQIIFDGMRTSSNVDLQWARFKEMSGTYQQLTLVAFQEVENALNNIESYAQRYKYSEDAVRWAEKSYELYLDRYTTGVTYYIDVVNTERDLLNFQMTLNELRGYRYVVTIQLIKALGGGW